MANEVELTSANFNEEVLESDIPVIIDFWADWCMPCKMIAPVLEELGNEYDGRLKIGKVNVDNEGELAGQYNIVSIPTLLVFNNGEIVQQHVGAAPRPTIEDLVKEYV
jgi:thioredoxin 1